MRYGNKHYFSTSTYDPTIAAKKEHNRQIFRETMQICRDGGYATAAGRVNLPATEDVLNASVFYVDPPKVEKLPMVEETAVDAVNRDCIEVTRDLVEKGYRPVMLNMANRHTPGGGVLNGARAQEESLFRQSNLCVSLYQYHSDYAKLLDLPMADKQYPMDRNTGGIYSGCVMFFRTGQNDGDQLIEKPFECAVVSVAAISHPDLDEAGRLVPWAIEATEKKIRTMLRIGLLNGHDAIVLGAWGCGAFRNPPDHMAEIFQKILNESEFSNKFKVVRFAVIEDHNSHNRNFEAFDRAFNKHDSHGGA
ncbi:MAG: TIGR02452 family protein [Kiritimatiellia bacterium]